MKNFNRGRSLVIVGLLALVSLVLFLTSSGSNSDALVEGYDCKSAPDNAFVLSPASQCKGSPYLYSGDDEFSRMCQSLMQTQEGREDIARYNCAPQFDGIPKSFPTYSAHTNSLWRDVDGSPAGV